MVRPLDDSETLARTVVLAGWTPAMSLWTRAAERWSFAYGVAAVAISLLLGFGASAAFARP